MDTRTKNKINKLHRLGFNAKGIALATGATVQEARDAINAVSKRKKKAKAVVKKKRKDPTPRELQSHADYLIALGNDPEVVRANFGV